MKSLFDKAASALGIVTLSPVFAVVSAVNTLHFKASPFYTIQRQGKDGKLFEIIKFRSMRPHTEETRLQANDSFRRTPWGNFLRATSIDELPQLINILKGDMSFVGPRPRGIEGDPYDVIPPGYEDILSVRPGLTGPWQVAAIGRDTKIDPVEKVRIDAEYVRNAPSLGKDIALMVKTIPAFIKGHDGERIGATYPLPGKIRKGSVPVSAENLSHEHA